MTTRPFHHGNLRAELLEQAQAMLREDGVDGLSLRELARRAGVSHGAPRSHFIDRQALLDALAERGFGQLTDRVRTALEGPGSIPDRFGRVGQAYVGFAVEDAALMELMFTAKTSAVEGPVRDAAVRLFQVLDAAMATPDADASNGPDAPDDDARERFKLLFAATMQGIAALIAARRVTPEIGDVLVRDATAAMLESRLGARAVTRR